MAWPLPRLPVSGRLRPARVRLRTHHVTHRADGGRTSLTNLKDYCWWHHHVVLHALGWTLPARPDGTSQVTSPDGKIIRSHSPPPRPGLPTPPTGVHRYLSGLEVPWRQSRLPAG